MAQLSLLSSLRRRAKGASRGEGSSTFSLDAFRRASLMTRTLITVLSLLTVFTIFIGTLSLVAVAATKKAFPAAEAEQPLASPAGAGEAEARPGKKPRAKGDRTE